MDPLTFARHLRTNLTAPERRLWNQLRGRRLGSKFRRQAPMGPYVVDFLCSEASLVVELDGLTHDDLRRDELRDAFLARTGYLVLRFTNDELREDLDAVLTRIAEVAAGRLPPDGKRRGASGIKRPWRASTSRSTRSPG